MGGRHSKRIGKDGERNAHNFIEAIGGYCAMTEISGLAGDDKFFRAPDGTWWSMEVKNRTTWNKNYTEQARRQAEERFQAIQKELQGQHSDVYYAQNLHQYRKTNWCVFFHPRGIGARADDWWVVYSKGGRVRLTHMNLDTGWTID